MPQRSFFEQHGFVNIEQWLVSAICVDDTHTWIYATELLFFYYPDEKKVVLLLFDSFLKYL